MIRITLEACMQAVLALHHSYRKNSQAEGYDLGPSRLAFHSQLLLNVLSKTWHQNRMQKSGKNDVQSPLDALFWLITSKARKQPVSLSLGFSRREVPSYLLILFYFPFFLPFSLLFSKLRWFFVFTFGFVGRWIMRNHN